MSDYTYKGGRAYYDPSIGGYKIIADRTWIVDHAIVRKFRDERPETWKMMQDEARHKTNCYAAPMLLLIEATEFNGNFRHKFKPHEEAYALPIEGPKEMKTKLYAVIGKDDMFGTKLATDSEGRTVLEMKGSGEVKAFKPEELEEVMPYTVAVQFLSSDGKKYHYQTDKGSVSKNDIVVFDAAYTHNAMAIVTDINTKSERADKVLKGRVIKTKPIG